MWVYKIRRKTFYSPQTSEMNSGTPVSQEATQKSKQLELEDSVSVGINSDASIHPFILA